MNALQRANLLADLEGDIEGGVSKSLEDLIGERGYDFHKLDRYTLAAIDERFFSCDKCGWTHTVDEMGETEAGDGLLCVYCEAVLDAGYIG